MEIVSIENVNEVYVKVVADPGTKMEMSEYFTFEVPGAKFMPSVRNKMWDGKIRLLNVMTGYIYKGLLPYIDKFCQTRDYELQVEKGVYANNEEDTSIAYELAKQFDTKYEPRDYQANAVAHAFAKERALLLSPTASGKSFIIYLLTRYHIEQGRRALIIVPTTSLVHQMATDFVDYNKGNELNIHKIMGGVDKNIDSPITITTWQSIYKLRKDWFAKFDVVIGDEAHLFKAKSLTSILEKLPDCKYRYGFTGTLDGTQTHKLVLEGLFGGVYEVTKTAKLIEEKTLADFSIKAVILEYEEQTRKLVKGKSYQDEIDWIVRNDARNKFIRNLAWSLKGNTLILFQFVEKHGKVLYPLLERDGRHIHFVHGGVKGEEREDVRHITESSDNNIILASYGTFSTGINIRKLDSIIFASPSKSKIRNLQSIGRVLRKGNGKESAVLYDIVDNLTWKAKENFAVQHFKDRINIYAEEGFDYKIYNVDIKG